jgi:hypothetical protein
MTGRASSVSVSRQPNRIWPGVAWGSGPDFYEKWPDSTSLPDNWTAPVEEPVPQPVFYKQLARKSQTEVYAKILTGPANQPLNDADFDAMVPDQRAVANWKAARSRYAVSGLQKDYDEMIRWVRPDVEGYDSEDGLAEPGRSVDGGMEDRKHRGGLGRYWHR